MSSFKYGEFNVFIDFSQEHTSLVMVLLVFFHDRGNELLFSENKFTGEIESQRNNRTAFSRIFVLQAFRPLTRPSALQIRNALFDRSNTIHPFTTCSPGNIGIVVR